MFGEGFPTAVLSGPSFAADVVKGLPTAVTVASHDPDFATWLATCLHSDTFRAYTSDDVAGVELGGAVKNVLAIAAGIADGLSFERIPVPR
jgi:glycerol-3-phosphate dehydrogenase (NAD(P)+)